MSVGVTTPSGVHILTRQIAGLIARRIVTHSRVGDTAKQGERFGIIRFGSRVDVFVPRASRSTIRIAVGDRVRVGASVLAEFPQ
jgi:phosphatidylserine decarboxylase